MVAHNKVFIDGTLGASGQEAFSCGFSYGDGQGGGVFTPAALQTWAEDIAAYLDAASFPGVDNLLSTSGTMTQVRTYYYPGNGAASAAGQALIPTGRTGTGTAAKPPQCACVVTLLTGLAGRRYRGRFYWPWLATSFNGTTLKGQLPGAIATEFAAMLNAIGGEAGTSPALVPMVYSQAGDVLTPVSQVRVGDVVDTQRRRRDNLTESYLFADV